MVFNINQNRTGNPVLKFPINSALIRAELNPPRSYEIPILRAAAGDISTPYVFPPLLSAYTASVVVLVARFVTRNQPSPNLAPNVLAYESVRAI